MCHNSEGKCVNRRSPWDVHAGEVGPDPTGLGRAAPEEAPSSEASSSSVAGCQSSPAAPASPNLLRSDALGDAKAARDSLVQ